MSSDDRIEKLERQVEELKGLVAHLQSEARLESEKAAPLDSAEPAAATPAGPPASA